MSGQLPDTNTILIDGERIDSTVRLSGGTALGAGSGAGVMLLTDRRVIHLQGDGKHQKAAFAAIQDVELVEISFDREGYGAFIWAAMALVVALVLYFFIIDHFAARIAASVVVALLGVYLIVDKLTFSRRPMVVFKAGSSQVRCELKGEQAAANVQEFIKRFFEFKQEIASNGAGGRRRFAPR